MSRKVTWQELLDRHKFLQLPVAHDALTARLIEMAGFPAFQIGGLALIASHVALPDVDLAHYGEISTWSFDILHSTELPVMVDASNAGADPKMVARVVRGFEADGAAAIFLEDQATPKKCGHMAGKKLVSPAAMEAKLRVALDVAGLDLFIMARTDAYASEGIAGVLHRGELYLNAGADGLYVEGIDNEYDLRKVPETFPHVPLALSLLEGNGKTPWLTPKELQEMGYRMVLYPTSLLFRSMRAIADGLKKLRAGSATPSSRGFTMEEYGEVVKLPYWQEIEKEMS